VSDWGSNLRLLAVIGTSSSPSAATWYCSSCLALTFAATSGFSSPIVIEAVNCLVFVSRMVFCCLTIPKREPWTIWMDSDSAPMKEAAKI